VLLSPLSILRALAGGLIEFARRNVNHSYASMVAVLGSVSAGVLYPPNAYQVRDDAALALGLRRGGLCAVSPARGCGAGGSLGR